MIRARAGKERTSLSMLHLSILEILVKVCVRRDRTKLLNESNGVIPSDALGML